MVSRSSHLSLGILFFINLINYMDRYTIAGVLKTIQEYYHLDDSQGGLLQTYFVVSYMVMAPIFGYLGDRHSRKTIMAVGILFWSLTTFLGSLVPANLSGLFFLMRALVGTGEASYSTIAPTIIADIFPEDQRKKALAFFYFAIPVGSGLGYIAGSAVASLFGHWVWALRVTPVLGALSVVALVLFLEEPRRGQADGATATPTKSTVSEDVKYVIKIKSYLLSTVGFTSVCFTTGALSWFAPKYMGLALAVRKNELPEAQVNLIFGGITCFAGIFGVIIGVGASHWYKQYSQKADPMVCAIGVFVSVPLTFLAVTLADESPILTWFLMFFAITALCVNWSLVAEIILYVIVPHRRSFAQSLQILVAHLFGDASSPYIVGRISDAFRHNSSPIDNFISLQYGFYTTCFVLILGGIAFLWTTRYIVSDREACAKKTKGEDSSVESNNPSPPIERNSPMCRDDKPLERFPPVDTLIEPDTNVLLTC